MADKNYVNDINLENLTAADFEFCQKDDNIRDKKLDTKPIGAFRDAMIRFCKNKSSIVAAVIICCIILFALLAPVFSQYEQGFKYNTYKYMRPKSEKFAWLGLDGQYSKKLSVPFYYELNGIAVSTIDTYENGVREWTEGGLAVNSTIGNQSAYAPIQNLGEFYGTAEKKTYSMADVDCYFEIGFKYESLTPQKYAQIKAFEEASGVKVIYPMVDLNTESEYFEGDDTQYTQTWYFSYKGYPCTSDGRFFDVDGNEYTYKQLSKLDAEGKGVTNLMYFPNYASKYVEAGDITAFEEGQKYFYEKDLAGTMFYFEATTFEEGVKYYVAEVADYISMDKGNTYKARVLSYTYYQYVFWVEQCGGQFIENEDGTLSVDMSGNTEFYHVPDDHLMGTDAEGYDYVVRLAQAIRLSLLLAVCVSLINFVIGIVYGTIEGYYGGRVDLILERISDVLAAVPFIVVASLFQIFLVQTGKVNAVVGILFAFVLTGWIGIAHRTRTQFYRFKGMEYVLASRTLGASDLRLMFKHILPNALGTLITSTVLIIPSVVFSESTLSYLGIVSFNGETTSLGTLLSKGFSAGLTNYPYLLIIPSIIIALLLISFNLFGNGLRDAFNPSLRGTE